MSERTPHEECTNLLDERQLIETNYSETDSFGRKSCKTCLIAGILIVVIGFGLGFGLYYGLRPEQSGNCPCVELGTNVSESKLGVYRRYAISVDTAPCAPVGTYDNRSFEHWQT